MIERGYAARYAVSAFYESFNDIDIFVEDTAIGYEKLFATLLSRAAASTLSIDRVFPLGPRGQVLANAANALASSSKRKAIYLVDGDLYLLTGEFENLPKNVIVLPRYCVENFLWDEASFLELVDEEDHKCDAHELVRRMDYKGWWERTTIALKPLFVIFAVSHALKSGIPTVARGMKSVCLNREGEVDLEKATQIGDEIHNLLIAQFGRDAVQECLVRVEENVHVDNCFLTTYVSGKDFVLPLLILRMRAITRTKNSNLNLKMRLSRKCNPSPLAPVVRSIFDVAGAPH